MVKKNRLISFAIIVITLAVVIGITMFDAAADLKLGLDLQGGVEILYEVEPINDGEESDENQEINLSVLEATVQSLRQRVDVLGVNEPNFTIEEPNRIRVQLAGIDNEEEARELLATSARLSFRDVEGKEYLDGSDLVEGGARQDFDPTTNQAIVSLQLKDGNKFGAVTRTILEDPNLPNILVIWLDYEEGDDFYVEAEKANPKFISAPMIRNVLNETNVQIDGGFTVQSAQQLADILNAGSLPVNLVEEYSRSVSAQFGIDALNETVFAGAIGILLIFIFMIVVYRLPGFISVITLSLYVYLVILVFGWMNGVLTLPGIAALILGVGMAVDANIITYERMKEELILGKSMVTAFESANKNSLSSIIDANLTTLIAAGVLFAFGTSSVKGFATLLIVSIVLSLFTSVYVSRFLLDLLVKSRVVNDRYSWFGLRKSAIRDISDTSEVEPKLFGKTFDIAGHWKKYLLIGLSLVVLGLGSFLIMGLNLSVDFTSGTRIDITSDEFLTEEVISEEFSQLELEYHSLSYSGNDNEIAVIRFSEPLDQETVAEVREHFDSGYDAEINASTVSPVVGRELVRNALMSLMIASIFIIIYIAIRFEFYSAVVAVSALVFDVVIMILVFSIFQIEFDETIIAAILTIIGYSINATIVNFDRIRENMKAEKRIRSYEQLRNVVNKSLSQTFFRSLNTSLTIIFTVVSILFLGASAITNFTIALLVGLIAGMFSSMLIVGPIWAAWRGKSIKEKPIVFEEKKRMTGPQV
ncbi:protein translocase subunit SecD [Amphibacillus xylanus]|uniref:Multifunctional fusion protein n=1 Tax=Amphibacillus xylanus (strain ATCC 51415 / DSM 6626 / JCM 7361 / LMG 17667 / NBRC 15112 / Ep01) TaxID=698758 RepID=K0J236_AMPXN|nr:protein translocase subunit SecD [Amphibacillus xylanus]BAM47177.1 protein-export membrane protein SecDF [Amphibacillus xylanus NBRC 15112]